MAEGLKKLLRLWYDLFWYKMLIFYSRRILMKNYLSIIFKKIKDIMCRKQFDCILYSGGKINAYTSSIEDSYQGYAYSF